MNEDNTEMLRHDKKHMQYVITHFNSNAMHNVAVKLAHKPYWQTECSVPASIPKSWCKHNLLCSPTPADTPKIPHLQEIWL